MKKFQDSKTTAKGEDRAWVTLNSLDTLWFNTGTRCNLSCENCYIESNPTNDRLSYLTREDVEAYLQEIKTLKLSTRNISFTGGEPFINPHMIQILDLCLSEGFTVLVLTNAYKVIKRHKENLLGLKNKYEDNFKIRVSLDHYSAEVHEKERGEGTFLPTLENIKWFCDEGFSLSIAGRSLVDENMETIEDFYQSLFDQKNISLKLTKENLVVFPEMHARENVPEITTSCWGILNISPDNMMCASERMIVKRKGEDKPVVLPCTLLAYDKQFELGYTLGESKKDVYLNHEFCAKFCVLGGASCSGG